MYNFAAFLQYSVYLKSRNYVKLWHFISDIHESSNEGRESVPKRLKTEHGKSQVRVRLLTLESVRLGLPYLHNAFLPTLS